MSRSKKEEPTIVGIEVNALGSVNLQNQYRMSANACFEPHFQLGKNSIFTKSTTKTMELSGIAFTHALICWSCHLATKLCLTKCCNLGLR